MYLSPFGKITKVTLSKLAKDACYDHVYKPFKSEWESVTNIPYSNKVYILKKGNYSKCFRSAKACYNYLISIIEDSGEF